MKPIEKSRFLWYNRRVKLSLNRRPLWYTDNYISIEEAADYLGVKASTIRSWIKNKGMPHYRVGGKLLKFKRSEIDEWIKKDDDSTQENALGEWTWLN